LPKELREKLNKECPLEIKSELSGSKNSDSLKTLITLEDGAKIAEEGLNIGARHISVSTSGIVDGIRKFTKEPFPLNSYFSACSKQ
jgi:adenine C2-methylase RlmN of 23S rRNA A2503 and tRNA A37